jgi:hypothetical protein
MVAVPEREAMDRVTALGTRTVKCPGLCSVGTTTIEKYDNEGNDEDVKGGGGRAGEVDVCVCVMFIKPPQGPILLTAKRGQSWTPTATTGTRKGTASFLCTG